MSVRGSSSCCQVWCISLIAAGAALFAVGCSGRGGGNGRTLTIAVVGPMTGPSAARGRDLEQAARLAVDDANALEDVKIPKIQLSVCDDGDDARRAREVAQQVAMTSAVAVADHLCVVSKTGRRLADGHIYHRNGLCVFCVFQHLRNLSSADRCHL